MTTRIASRLCPLCHGTGQTCRRWREQPSARLPHGADHVEYFTCVCLRNEVELDYNEERSGGWANG